ncbi:MAG TPA: flagellar motor protein MotB [Gammaproteobacteria bacterium]|nr:flagellar motor protein MotB [Gammaproteobacteria bacterium]
MSDNAAAVVIEEGLPPWVMTFADLMSLLMCFFVLLLSFSEMDVSKYKEMAGSMKNAFGVQRAIKVREPPKGINIIAREFSPGRPEPTVMNVVRQMTTNDLRVNLDLGKERHRPAPTPRADHEPDRDKTLKAEDNALSMAAKQHTQADGLTEAQKKELAEAKALAVTRLEEKLKAEQQLAGPGSQQNKGVAVDREDLEKLIEARMAEKRRKKLEQSAKLISDALGREIKDGSIDVETAGQKIIIRVREKASFSSGRAELKSAFRPILARVAKILKGSEGKIIVAGHTDNVPIYTERFRSNWELSSARAVSVAHAMMQATNIPPNRFLIQGYADTAPMVKNDSAANRAKNRRVEIILQQGDDKESADKSISGKNPATGKAADLPVGSGSRQTVSKPVAVSAKAVAPAGKRTGLVKQPPAKPAGIKAGHSGSRKPAVARSKQKAKTGLGIKAGGRK